ncbi:MAG TPA: Holliday junction resolvase RuvX [Mycobacteriales bacterium]|nr:Holliday junction resolvase RuvX [Mycobacteriales bacterium]
MTVAAVRSGVIVAVDVGEVRVGVAASDPHGLLASPVSTLARDGHAAADLAELATIVREREAVEVVVGLPITLAGREGPAAASARAYADALAPMVAPVPVRLVDERLTTVVGAQGLRAAGVKGRKQRAVVDQAAAVALLQGVLDAARGGAR